MNLESDILRFLADNGRAQAPVIADGLKQARGSVEKALIRLRRQGLIASGGTGKLSKGYTIVRSAKKPVSLPEEKPVPRKLVYASLRDALEGEIEKTKNVLSLLETWYESLPEELA